MSMYIPGIQSSLAKNILPSSVHWQPVDSCFIDSAVGNLSGISLQRRNFRLAESKGSVNPALVRQVFEARLPVYVVRQFISEAECRQLVNNFNLNTGLQVRVDVAGHEVGVNHFGADLVSYLAEAAVARPAVTQLFDNVTSPVERSREYIAESLDVPVRLAVHEGRLAGEARALTWEDKGNWSLQPHIDFSQTQNPQLNGFEIQNTVRGGMVAVNLYPSIGISGGELIVGNFIPSRAALVELGVEFEGYPLPEELLTQTGYFKVDIRPGDLVFLNGDFVHGVNASVGTKTNPRLLISYFASVLANKREVVCFS